MDNSTHDARIELAIADLNQQTKPNVRATAKKFHLARTTLQRRYNGKSMSKQAAKGEYRQRLNFAQEEALIDVINRLTDRAIPPTPAMVRCLAEELVGGPVGKNWAAEFVKRHKDRLKSVYLQNIDRSRVHSEYVPSYQRFYELVL